MFAKIIGLIIVGMICALAGYAKGNQDGFEEGFKTGHGSFPPE